MKSETRSSKLGADLQCMGKLSAALPPRGAPRLHTLNSRFSNTCFRKIGSTAVFIFLHNIWVLVRRGGK